MDESPNGRMDALMTELAAEMAFRGFFVICLLVTGGKADFVAIENRESELNAGDLPKMLAHKFSMIHKELTS